MLSRSLRPPCAPTSASSRPGILVASRAARAAALVLALAVPLVACSSPGAATGSSGSGGAGAGSAASTSTGDGGGTSTGNGGGACTAGLDAGFTSAPGAYAIPTARCQTRFDALSKGAKITYSLLDLTGDGKGDLVVAKDECDAEIGAKRWDIYPAGEKGFAPSPSPYSLPAGRCNTAFDALVKQGNVVYGLFDLNHDGRPDLVVFSDTCDPAVGTSHWDVYAGGATGFAAMPTPYTLPTARCKTRFDAPEGQAAVRYSLLDVDADSLTDLVVTHDNCDSAVGATHWDFYRGGATGFAAAASAYTVPIGRCQTKFDAFTQAGPLDYGLFSVGSIARAAIVVTADDCDSSLGKQHWDRYLAGATGFAPAPTPYGVPAGRCQSKFDAAASSTPVAFGLFDLSCDGRPDLVVASDDCDAEIGVARWDVYLGGDDSFAPAPKPLALPAGRCNTKFDAFAGGAKVAYALTTFLGGKPSLVVTSDDCDDSVGASHWDLYTLP